MTVSLRNRRHRFKTDPVARAPRPPGRRGSHWGTLAALGQVSPHWGRLLTCPNGPLPTPNAPLPAPMTRCLSQCGSSPLHDRTTALPAALQPSSPAAGCHRALHHHAAPYPLRSTGQVLGFVGSGLGRFPSCTCVLALRLLQHGAAQCEAGAGGVAPVDPGRGRLPNLGAIALQTRMRGPALIVDEPAFAQGVESLDHNGAPRIRRVRSRAHRMNRS